MDWTWVQTGMFVGFMGFIGCAFFIYFMIQDASNHSWSSEDSANFIRIVQLAFFLFLAMCYFGDVGNVILFKGPS